jgi:hypothetical protein
MCRDTSRIVLVTNVTVNANSTLDTDMKVPTGYRAVTSGYIATDAIVVYSNYPLGLEEHQWNKCNSISTVDL